MVRNLRHWGSIPSLVKGQIVFTFMYIATFSGSLPVRVSITFDKAGDAKIVGAPFITSHQIILSDLGDGGGGRH